jgi:hypothetical protein
MNQLALSELDGSFALGAGASPPPGYTPLQFEALCIAEGEWSQSCKRLGVAKAIDRFASAIGLVVNLEATGTAAQAKQGGAGENERQGALRSFVYNAGLGEPIAQLARDGLPVENLEYLRGVRHYCAATIPEAALVANGALKAELPAAELLQPANVNIDRLRAIGRAVGSACGVPAESPLCGQHGVQLFDFSTRARALCPFRLLALRERGAQVLALDIEGQPVLAAARTAKLARELAAASQLVAEKKRAAATARDALGSTESLASAVESSALVTQQRLDFERAEEHLRVARERCAAHEAERGGLARARTRGCRGSLRERWRSARTPGGRRAARALLAAGR